MLHMGMTSISLRGCSHEREAKCQARSACERCEPVVFTQELQSRPYVHVARRSAKRLRASAGRGLGACDAPRAHNKRTLGKSRRTVNFPPIQNYRQAHPHVITLRFGVSTNGMAGAQRPPTKPPPPNWAPELTHPARCGWLAAKLGSRSHWVRRALFLERYIVPGSSLARSLTYTHATNATRKWSPRLRAAKCAPQPLRCAARDATRLLSLARATSLHDVPSHTLGAPLAALELLAMSRESS